MAAARRAGYEPRALGSFLAYALDSRHTDNHFATIVKIDHVEYIIDPTAAQFAEYGFSGPFVGTRAHWENTIVFSEKKPVFMYKEFVSATAARNEFSSNKLVNVDPLNLPPDVSVKTDAAWYRNAKRDAALARDLERRQEAARRALRERQRAVANEGHKKWAKENPDLANQALDRNSEGGVVSKIRRKFGRIVITSGNG
jgi:hypothetical protein